MDQPVVSWGAPHAERADAARNRRHLLATARQMLAEQGLDTLTMDALAEQAGLGKGTVFRQSEPQPGKDATSSARPEADHAWHSREMAETRQPAVQAGPAPAGPEGQQWRHQAHGLESGRSEPQPDRNATSPARPETDHAWHPRSAPATKYEPEGDWEAGSLYRSFVTVRPSPPGGRSA